jgi:hypothetical protein
MVLMGTLHIRARHLVIYAVAAALAVANGVAPRHAQAAAHAQAMSGAAQKAPAPHAASAHHADLAVTAQPPCHGTAESAPASSPEHGPLHNCCVASCAAIALIFASTGLQEVLQPRDFIAVAPAGSMPVTLASADPPPR